MLYEDVFKKNAVRPEPPAAPDTPPAADAKALLIKLLSVYTPAERLSALEEGLRFWPDNEALRELKDLWQLRYKAQKGRIPYADHGLALLIELITFSALYPSGRSEKQITQFFAKNKLVRWVAAGRDQALRGELFFGEAMQILHYFADTCRRDKHFASSLMGLIKASPEKVENKIRDDLSYLHKALDRAMNAPKFAAAWTKEMKLFGTALELFLNNLAQ